MSSSVELEKLGIKGMIIATQPFNDACKGMAKMGGMPDLKWAVVPHPIGSLNEEQLRERARLAMDQFVPIVTGNDHS